ncbi:amastin-like protein [Leptomonas seymouri]|uniref:Amastin-like protein n=1 Tax=Leptomonas seymouri TaxID=5684 RepID=A0A0N0P4Q6_LEPSE|nr:amastin-like protein [Leptomonas seymouri]|eukprot:KPI85576.1 amastin-like protein [Leptomonas seymouri]
MHFSNMACKIGILIYSLLQLVVFLFIFVGTPIDMFRPMDENTLGDTPCLTLWGLKEKCYSTTYDARVNDLFEMCPERRARFRAAQAFAIMNIII